MLATSSCEYTMYLTDDSAFIRDVELSKNDLAFIEQNPDINQISLRLGKNITERPASIPVNNGKLEWDFIITAMLAVGVITSLLTHISIAPSCA